MKLTQAEIQEITAHLEAGRSIPAKWQPRLFANSTRTSAIGKEYRLVYEGKLTREEVLAQ